MPSSSCSSRISRSTWAWTVTSRAVVGSSAMSSRGCEASAMAIIARWRMPPERWCGYFFDGLAPAPGMPTRSSMSTAISRASRRSRRAVQAHHLDDLVADGVQRRERAHRLLEDHRADAAADGADRGCRAVERDEVDRRRGRGSRGGSGRWSPRAARRRSAGSTAPSSSCRSPIRRRGPRCSPCPIEKLTPSAAVRSPLDERERA